MAHPDSRSRHRRRRRCWNADLETSIDDRTQPAHPLPLLELYDPLLELPNLRLIAEWSFVETSHPTAEHVAVRVEIEEGEPAFPAPCEITSSVELGEAERRVWVDARCETDKVAVVGAGGEGRKGGLGRAGGGSETDSAAGASGELGIGVLSGRSGGVGEELILGRRILLDAVEEGEDGGVGEVRRGEVDTPTHVGDGLGLRARSKVGEEGTLRRWLDGVLLVGDGEGRDRPRSEEGVELGGEGWSQQGEDEGEEVKKVQDEERLTLCAAKT